MLLYISPVYFLLLTVSLFLLRTLYIEGERKLDFSGWCGAIQAAAGSGGDTLSQQQLTDTDIPVIVLSCIDYITQCGERHLLEFVQVKKDEKYSSVTSLFTIKLDFW